MDTSKANDEQRHLTAAAILAAHLTVQDVWVRYFGLTGDIDEYELDAYLNGLITLPSLECDLIAHAVNELIDEVAPLPRAPYRSTMSSRHLP
jgi:hypothetical protein